MNNKPGIEVGLVVIIVAAERDISKYIPTHILLFSNRHLDGYMLCVHRQRCCKPLLLFVVVGLKSFLIRLYAVAHRTSSIFLVIQFIAQHNICECVCVCCVCDENYISLRANNFRNHHCCCCHHRRHRHLFAHHRTYSCRALKRHTEEKRFGIRKRDRK